MTQLMTVHSSAHTPVVLLENNPTFLLNQDLMVPVTAIS
jgi:hypothetical protein